MVQQEQERAILLKFKVMPCKHEGAHDHRCCLFYHTDRDRRRPVFCAEMGEWSAMPLYLAEPCNESFDDGKKVCSRGEECIFCHSTVELLYHPEFFRKRLCILAMTSGCPRSHLCAYAHSRSELLTPCFTEEEEKAPSEECVTWNFKTQWCPLGGLHDWDLCMYSHTYRDWRRTPVLGYSSRPCPKWTQSIISGPAEAIYEMRCPNGMACPLAHGAKEQLYHPQFYKTSRCSDNCKRGPLCAFFHKESDRRQPLGAPLAAEDVATAVNYPLPWALQTLNCYQPTFGNPPRYHGLEEQVALKQGKGGKGHKQRPNRSGNGGKGAEKGSKEAKGKGKQAKEAKETKDAKETKEAKDTKKEDEAPTSKAAEASKEGAAE